MELADLYLVACCLIDKILPVCIALQGLIHNIFGGFLHSRIKEEAQTLIYCAVSDEVVQDTGKYFDACKVTKSSPDSTDEKLARAFWEKSAYFVDLMPHETVVWNWNKDCNFTEKKIKMSQLFAHVDWPFQGTWVMIAI